MPANSSSSETRLPPKGDQKRVAEVKTLLPFDVVRVALHVVKGWIWILLVAAICGAAAFWVGKAKFVAKYTAQVQVVRREAQSSLQATEMGESYQPREFNAATVSAMMRSGDLLERTGAQLSPPLSVPQMQQALVIRPEKNTDLISVAFTSDVSASHAATAINRYAGQVVDLTRQLQADEAKELYTFVTLQVERIEEEIGVAQKDLMAFSRDSGLYHAEKEIESLLGQLGDLDLKIEMARIDRGSIDYRLQQAEAELGKQDPALQRLALAQEKLAELSSSFTEQHPTVVDQRSKVVMLEKEASKQSGDATDSFRSTGNTVANNLYLDVISFRGQRERLDLELKKLSSFRDGREEMLKAIPDKNLGQARLQAKMNMLEEARSLLRGRQREAALFAERALGYYGLFNPASVDSVETSGPTRNLALVSVLGALLGAGMVVAWRSFRVAVSDGIVSPGDLRRICRREVLATLPPEETMNDLAMSRWRFAAWRSLVRHLPQAGEEALIVGILSAAPREGKTTLQHHLAKAALERGLQVMVVSQIEKEAEVPAGPGISIEEGLSDPGKVRAHLEGADPPALELFVPQDWVWTPRERSRWLAALANWRKERDLVILVELPPATSIQSLLLAETLPATVWLSNAGPHGRKQAKELSRAVHESGVQLVGAVLNRVAPVYRNLPDLARFGLCLGIGFLLGNPLSADELPATETKVGTVTVPPLPEPPLPDPFLIDPLVNGSPLVEPIPGDPPRLPIPVTKPNPPLAPWQERLMLGPGDVLNLQVYGHREYTRKDVPIGPDGNISYLQIHDYRAAGSTIDELREGLTKALRAYVQNAQVIVTPVAFKSKKYFLLGTVLDRGSYSLDRPMTLLEAVARARGISTGLLSQNTVEIADMRRAFVVREGKKLDIDFTKLFYEGDLTHNVQLSPGDYIYVPSNVVNEVYVLGAIDSPGQTGVTDSLTAIGAITVRGGFSEGAWKKQVLVVRDSLSENPKVFVVDAAAVIVGKAKDMILEPRDVVYVSPRPWRRAEEIADIAITAFLQAATATWTGNKVIPIIDDSENP